MGCAGAAARLGLAAGEGKGPSGCTGRAFPFLLNSVKLKFAAKERKRPWRWEMNLADIRVSSCSRNYSLLDKIPLDIFRGRKIIQV